MLSSWDVLESDAQFDHVILVHDGDPALYDVNPCIIPKRSITYISK